MKIARTHQGRLEVSETARDALMKRVQRGSGEPHLIFLKKNALKTKWRGSDLLT